MEFMFIAAAGLGISWEPSGDSVEILPVKVTG